LTTAKTSAFCERCGTPTVSDEAPATGLTALIDRARAVAVSSIPPPDDGLRLCLSCRGYVCGPCLNDEAGMCLDCAPQPAVEQLTHSAPAAPAVAGPSDERARRPALIGLHEVAPVPAATAEAPITNARAGPAPEAARAPAGAREPEAVAAQAEPDARAEPDAQAEPHAQAEPIAAAGVEPNTSAGPLNGIHAAHRPRLEVRPAAARPGQLAPPPQEDVLFIGLMPPGELDDLFAGLDVTTARPGGLHVSPAIERPALTKAVDLAAAPVAPTPATAPSLPIAATPPAIASPVAMQQPVTLPPAAELPAAASSMAGAPEPARPPLTFHRPYVPPARPRPAASTGGSAPPSARACNRCDLPISVRAAFCRRCGSAQPQVA
jgi:hypothetical protein